MAEARQAALDMIVSMPVRAFLDSDNPSVFVHPGLGSSFNARQGIS